MRTKFRWFALASLTSAAAVGACGTGASADGDLGPSENSQPVEVACAAFADAAGWHRAGPVSASAEASSERIAAVGEATWPVALDLLRVVPATEVANIAQSPTSFYASLGMAYARWEGGQCGQRVAEILRFPETGDDLHQALGASLQKLGERALPAEGDAPALVLNLTPSRWDVGQKDVGAIGDIERLYGANLYAVEDTGEAARQLVNCVIEQQSAGLMQEFIPEGVINGSTRALDINVTYLKAPWPRAFDEAKVDFRPEGGEVREVEGLSQAALSTVYHEASSFDAIHLPLRGGELTVLLVMQKATMASTFEEFVLSLDAEQLQAARDATTTDTFEFKMPKIDIASQSLDYNERLAFECEPFTLRALIHGAAVVLDEGGIEAVAATVAETWNDGGFQPTTRPFTVDRPFLFFVYDEATRFVLFSGRVLELG
jgi:serine protease inhibitor